MMMMIVSMTMITMMMKMTKNDYLGTIINYCSYYALLLKFLIRYAIKAVISPALKGCKTSAAECGRIVIREKN